VALRPSDQDERRAFSISGKEGGRPSTGSGNVRAFDRLRERTGSGNEGPASGRAVSKKCHAHNRKGGPCGKWAVPGKSVCYFHGGAPGSGAQEGNLNRYVHGLRAESENVPDEVRERAEEYARRDGVPVVIAMIRAKLDDAYKKGIPITHFARGTDGYARLVRLEYDLARKSKDEAEERLGQVLETMAERLGLKGFIEDAEEVKEDEPSVE